MGMFNYIYLTCPKCGEEVKTQSKGGSCLLEHFDVSEAPHGDLEYIDGESIKCPKCGHYITFRLKSNYEII